MEEDGGERAQRRHPTSSETLISEPHLGSPSACPETALHPGEEDQTESKPELNQAEIFRTLEVVERDSLAIADSFTTLFASLRLALFEVTGNSVDHMHCFSEAAGCLQESVLDSATKGNRYINSSLRCLLLMCGAHPCERCYRLCLMLVRTIKSYLKTVFMLPVMLDVGTNNQKLLEDRLYLGLRQHRLEGEEYISFVDEFMDAVHTCWPKAIVQFEDFQVKWAFETLQRYRKSFCTFNDDIQGTAGVALAGLLGAVRAQSRPLADFVKQKIVGLLHWLPVHVTRHPVHPFNSLFLPFGAGLGVLNMAVQAVARMAGNGEAAAKKSFLSD